MSRADELRADFELLGKLLKKAEGSGAAAIAAQRRILSAELELIEKPKEASLVDELAAKRAKSGAGRPPARRRKSG